MGLPDDDLQGYVPDALLDAGVPEQVVIPTSGHDYWCIDAGTLRDFTESAQKSADVTGRVQVIHMHAWDVACEDGQVHYIIQPDPIRSPAVGGSDHR